MAKGQLRGNKETKKPKKDKTSKTPLPGAIVPPITVPTGKKK
ncbi:hypothetical protein BH09PSE6_BH09PSE6_21240 [soil metagenome]